MAGVLASGTIGSSRSMVGVERGRQELTVCGTGNTRRSELGKAGGRGLCHVLHGRSTQAGFNERDMDWPAHAIVAPSG